MPRLQAARLVAAAVGGLALLGAPGSLAPALSGAASPGLIVFARTRLGTTCSPSGLAVVSSAGGATRALTHQARADLTSPVWSPDGREIAYSLTPACDPGSAISIASSRSDGTHPHQVTRVGYNNGIGSFDLDPAYSPDGKQIAFTYGTTVGGALDVVPAGGGRTRTLVAQSARVGAFQGPAAWSRDGKRIAYLGEFEVYAVPAGGGVPRTIARNPAYNTSCDVSGIAWSPDGKQLAVAGGAGIWLVTVGPHSRRHSVKRLAIRARCAAYPSFSPDGKAIVFDAPHDGRPGSPTAIMVANTDGSGLRALSYQAGYASVHPSWRP